jgi:hypothetical protein
VNIQKPTKDPRGRRQAEVMVTNSCHALQNRPIDILMDLPVLITQSHAIITNSRHAAGCDFHEISEFVWTTDHRQEALKTQRYFALHVKTRAMGQN